MTDFFTDERRRYELVEPYVRQAVQASVKDWERREMARLYAEMSNGRPPVHIIDLTLLPE